jgi:surfeit locus 1 family protein
VTTKTGKRQFRPALVPTLAAVVLIAGFCRLGFWQLDRAAEKRALFAAFDAGQSSQPIAFSRWLAKHDGRRRYGNVRLEGHFLGDRQILLDSMVHDGRPGYQVVTPFAARGQSALVLVNRGWVPQGDDRTRLPDVRVSSKNRVIVGQVADLPRPGLDIGAGTPAAGHDWPVRLEYPHYGDIQLLLGRNVMPLVIDLSPSQPDGYVRDWRPNVMGPRRHLGYAVQWFALALAVLVVYVAVNLRRVETDTEHDDG